MNKKTFLLLFILFTSFFIRPDFLSAGETTGVFTRDLYFGLRNDPDVTRLQEFLRDQSLYSGPITGNFFALTQNGVKKFQAKEGVSPAAGYFGPLTRVKANSLAKASPQVEGSQIALLTSQIQVLQAQLKLLQEKLAAEKAAVGETSATTTADIVAPAFTRSPKVSQSGFVLTSPLGARYPYRVIFDWAVDETGFIEESVECVPPLKIAKPSGRATEYFPEPHTNYSCDVSVKDLAGNKTAGNIKFNSPNWTNIAGNKTISFPDIVVTAFKIGEFTVYNGTTSDILLTDFAVDLTDEMDSTFNRGRKVNFVLRDGPTAIDPLISGNEFTFITTPPKIGEPHKSAINFSFPILLKPGNEKMVSLWVEQLEFVKSGTLKLKSNKLNATTAIDAIGGFEFLLTKTAGL